MHILANVRTVEIEPAHVADSIDIAIRDTRIHDIGTGLISRYPDAEITDLSGATIMPGFVCAHHHIYSALARGITTPIAASNDFVQTLQHLWWRLDTAINADILRVSALIAAVEAAQCGVTSIIDHHASPSFINGSLDVIRKAFHQVGVRGILCYETTDRHGPEGAEAGVRENITFAESVSEVPQETRLIEAAIGAHAPFTLGDRTLAQLADAVRATGRGIHLHVAEDRYDSSYAHHRYRQDPVERLTSAGVLCDKGILVHGVHLTDDDIKRINTADASLVHNPRSNMNNHVGYMSRLALVNRVALGTDGIGADMLEELRFAFFKHRDTGGNRWPDTFARYLQNGNRILEKYFGGTFGKLEAGSRADLVVLDYPSPTPIQPENVAAHLVFGLAARHVRSVMVNGRFIYKDRAFPSDTTSIYAEAVDAARRLWSSM